MVPGNGEVEMEVKLEVEMEVEMDAPILQPNYTGAQGAPVYVDGKIGASILTFISTSILTSNLSPIWPPFRPPHFQVPLAQVLLLQGVIFASVGFGKEAQYMRS